MLQAIMRIPKTLGHVAIAMVIGHILLVYIFLFHPDQARVLLKGAKVVKETIIAYIIPKNYNHWVDLLLEEKALVFMFFTVMVRLLLDIIWEMLAGIWRLVSR